MIVFVFWNALRQIAVKAIGIFAYETFQARRACVMKTRFTPDLLAGVCPDWADPEYRQFRLRADGSSCSLRCEKGFVE